MKIVCIGSVNRDVVYAVDRIASAGETVQAHSRHESWGGKGLNQAIALARGGAEVRMAAAVNRTEAVVENILNSYGVRETLLHLSPEPTGHAVICVEESGQNCITVFGGANRTLTPDFLARALEPYGPGDVLVIQNETNALCEIIRQAYEKGIRICFNSSPFSAEILSLPLELVSCFLLNETEGYYLTGEQEARQILREARRRFPRADILLTLGTSGSLYLDDTGVYEQSAFSVRAEDTTAAGDTFTGFFLAALARGCDIRQALRTASAASALAVSRPGAAQSIPTLEETQQFLQLQTGGNGK